VTVAKRPWRILGWWSGRRKITGGSDSGLIDTGTSERDTACPVEMGLYTTGCRLDSRTRQRYALLVWVPVILGPNGVGSSIIAPTWITVALPIGMASALNEQLVSDIVFRSRRYLASLLYGSGRNHPIRWRWCHTELLRHRRTFSVGFFVFGPAESFWALAQIFLADVSKETANGVLNFISMHGGPPCEPLSDVSWTIQVIRPSSFR